MCRREKNNDAIVLRLPRGAYCSAEVITSNLVLT